MDQVLEDVANGYLTPDTAESHYRVKVDYVGDATALVRPPLALPGNPPHVSGLITHEGRDRSARVSRRWTSGLASVPRRSHSSIAEETNP